MLEEILKAYLIILLKYLEILLEDATRVSLQGQIATEDVIMDTLNDEYKKLERRFEFVRDVHTERMDAITNAKDYLQKSVLKQSTTFPQVSQKDEIYMQKREEFIYLSLDDPNFSYNFKEIPDDELARKLSAEKVNSGGYQKSCGDWCQYCAVREICMESYKYGKN